MLKSIIQIDWQQELKRMALGAAVLVPVVGLGWLVVFCVVQGYISGVVLFYIATALMVAYFIWFCGLMAETVMEIRQNERERKERKTAEAFSRLAGTRGH